MWRKKSLRTRPSRALARRRTQRLKRRTMAPSRPTLYPDQIGLALFTLVAIVVGTYVVLRFLL